MVLLEMEVPMITAAKTVSQIAVHMSVAFGVMYGFTGSLAFGGMAALLEPMIVVGVLPLHERLWQQIGASISQGRSHDRRSAWWKPARLIRLNRIRPRHAYDA
jgi:uncharacterized membrane protein